MLRGSPAMGFKTALMVFVCTLCMPNSIMKDLNCSYECNRFLFLGVFRVGESLRLGTALGLREGLG